MGAMPPVGALLFHQPNLSSIVATLLFNSPANLRPTRALNTLFSDMLRETLPGDQQPTPSFGPAADILESAQGFELHLALPSVK